MTETNEEKISNIKINLKENENNLNTLTSKNSIDQSKMLNKKRIKSNEKENIYIKLEYLEDEDQISFLNDSKKQNCERKNDYEKESIFNFLL